MKDRTYLYEQHMYRPHNIRHQRVFSLCHPRLFRFRRRCNASFLGATFQYYRFVRLLCREREDENGEGDEYYAPLRPAPRLVLGHKSTDDRTEGISLKNLWVKKNYVTQAMDPQKVPPETDSSL
jgi:hypothetical protein